MSLKIKRTLEVEKRTFNVKRGSNFFIAETAKQLMECLICCEVIKTLKGYNAKQHFRRHEKHPYARL